MIDTRGEFDEIAVVRDEDAFFVVTPSEQFRIDGLFAVFFDRFQDSEPVRNERGDERLWDVFVSTEPEAIYPSVFGVVGTNGAFGELRFQRVVSLPERLHLVGIVVVVRQCRVDLGQ